MRVFRICLLVILLFSVFGRIIFRPPEIIDLNRALNEAFPERQFTEKSKSPPLYQTEDGLIAFNSYDITPGIRGYAGPIKTLVVINPGGRIEKVRILSHHETKNYVHYMLTEDYLRGFEGKSIRDPFEVDRDIDGISRATISVKALAATVRESARKVAEETFGYRYGKKEKTHLFDVKTLLLLLLFCLGVMTYIYTRRTGEVKRFRNLVMVLSVVTLGVYLTTPFSLIHIVNLLLFRYSYSPFWIILTAGTVMSFLFAGRFYCGYLCPFGGISEFMGRLKTRKWKIDNETDRRARYIKYIILFLAIPIGVVTGRPDFIVYEVYIPLFSLHGGVLLWILVTVMLLANLRVPRFWCRFLCPVGGIGGLLSKRDNSYKSCPDCPMGNPPLPHTSECIRCNRCIRKG